MKLEKFEDKIKKKRKVLLISIGIVLLVSISFLLYKTFARFSEEVSFQMMNGKVDYYGNSDVYFAFYKGDEMLDTMPRKDNEENIVFDHAECDNGASIEWDNEAWAPLVKNLSRSKTKCTLYFKKQKEIVLGKDVLPVESGDGLYKVELNNLAELSNEWNKTEYRYAGVNPDNYVRFNNEIWRIIGLVNVKTASGVEQRLKIVRTDGIENQKDFGKYAWDKPNNDLLFQETNNWTTSKLKDMLNGIYYESKIGECYIGTMNAPVNLTTCNFSGEGDLPKGLDDTARNMIDKDVIWNIGGSSTYEDVTVKKFYERERGTSTGNSNVYPSEWSKETDIGGKHNGIGLIYPSDYGYATNGGIIGRERCFAGYLANWSSEDGNYKSNCAGNDWLKSNGELWTISPRTDTSFIIFFIYSTGSITGDGIVFASFNVWPTVYLTSSTKIVDGSGTKEEPYVLQIVS